MNRRRRYRHNPSAIMARGRAMFGLPPINAVAWGTAGFAATAMFTGFIDTLVPDTWKRNPDNTVNFVTKYGELVAAVVATSALGKATVGRGPAALLGIGGGIFVVGQAVHDLIPNVIPGMHAYTPLHAYSPAHRARLSTMGRPVPFLYGGMPGLAQYNTGASMPQLAAPSHGSWNDANFAADGAMHMAGARFRRFA
jgi:hypothetical protein